MRQLVILSERFGFESIESVYLCQAIFYLTKYLLTTRNEFMYCRISCQWNHNYENDDHYKSIL